MNRDKTTNEKRVRQIVALLFTLCLIFTTSQLLFADELVQIKKTYEPMTFNPTRNMIVKPYTDDCGDYPAPQWEFVTLPDSIMTSYYDYMPFSYRGFHIVQQTENGDSWYMTWFGIPDLDPSTNRRQYYAEIGADGSLLVWNLISSNDIWQGYGDICIHPATGLPIATWHEDNPSSGYGITISYPNPTWPGSYVFFPPTNPGENEYLWPQLYLGPSPQGADYRRLYLIARKIDDTPGGTPCEVPRIMFIDVENSDDPSVLEPILEFEITVSYLNEIIDGFLYSNESPPPVRDKNIIHTPFGDINISGLSLPFLTIVLGGLDSFNPCAFFILIFLLNLLLFAKSRKRMLLIGGVFIFFSGLLYMLFMFILFETFILTKTYVTIITVIAGLLALSLGIINIKDFFFFKKGASLSIPEEKKPKLYKQMRNLVKNPKVTATLIGTIVLAGTVNFYELLCTLGLPLVYTRQLAAYNLSSIEYYSYILFYNIVYVIPLIIIVLIFVITLGKRKLTEWHGQVMKLETGIMLTLFGLLFLFNYQLLENIITPVLLLLGSLGLTAVVSLFYKKMKMRNDS